MPLRCWQEVSGVFHPIQHPRLIHKPHSKTFFNMFDIGNTIIKSITSVLPYPLFNSSTCNDEDVDNDVEVSLESHESKIHSHSLKSQSNNHVHSYDASNYIDRMFVCGGDSVKTAVFDPCLSQRIHRNEIVNEAHQHEEDSQYSDVSLDNSANETTQTQIDEESMLSYNSDTTKQVNNNEANQQIHRNDKAEKVQNQQIHKNDKAEKVQNVRKQTIGENVEKNRLKSLAKKHTGIFPFGIGKTSITILSALAALTCSILCRNSTSFVKLGEPVFIDSQFEPVNELGLFYMNLCRTNEFVNIDPLTGLSTITEVTYDEKDDVDGSSFFSEWNIIDENIVYSEATEIPESRGSDSTFLKKENCRKFKLESSIVNDGIWNAARIFLGFTTALGFLFTFAMASTSFWYSINLAVITTGMFVTYLCQSVAFLFFDTALCKRYSCQPSSGTILAIIASFFWFVAGLGSLWICIHKRYEKHEKEIELARNKSIIKNREDSMQIHWSILDYFRPRPNQLDDATLSSGDSRLSII